MVNIEIRIFMKGMMVFFQEANGWKSDRKYTKKDSKNHLLFSLEDKVGKAFSWEENVMWNFMLDWHLPHWKIYVFKEILNQYFLHTTPKIYDLYFTPNVLYMNLVIYPFLHLNSMHHILRVIAQEVH